MNVPEYFTFQWTTSEPAVAGGRWVVTNAPHGSAGATVVASGVLAPNQVASLNKPARFPIHFATFAPKKPPAAPYSITSSARRSTDRGTVSPRADAVRVLTISSKAVAC